MAARDPFDPAQFQYAVVAAEVPAPPPDVARALSQSNRVLMEHMLARLGVLLAYRCDLEDGSRVFAVDNRYLDRLMVDPVGRFVPLADKPVYFSPTNPTAGRAIVRDWQVLL